MINSSDYKKVSLSVSAVPKVGVGGNCIGADRQPRIEK